MIARRRFRPPLWAWLGYLPLMALLVSLGSWQLNRGLTKAGLDSDAEQAPVTRDWEAGMPPQITPPLSVRVRGRYRETPILLLDNQSYSRRPGLHLWHVFEPEQGPLMVVNQGWLPWHGGRGLLPALPPVPNDGEVVGLWRPLPRAGIALAQAACLPAGDEPLLVLYPTAETLACLTGELVADGMLLLNPDDGHPGVRAWSLTEAVPATRHFGYAAQWFMFGAVLSFFFIGLNLRTQV